MILSEKMLMAAANELKTYHPKEATGHNDGVRIEYYLKRAGLSPRNPWCASFQYSNALDAGYKPSQLPSHPGSVLGWFTWASAPERNLILTDMKDVRRGDLFYWLKGKHGHIGQIAEVIKVGVPGMYVTADGTKKLFAIPGWYIRCYEGNANNDLNSNEGLMVVNRWRYVMPKLRFIQMTRYVR